MWRRFIILIVLLITLNSCVSYVNIADITVFNPSGEVFCEYNNVCIDNRNFKHYGLIFYYEAEYIIIPNSMPYVIHYRTIELPEEIVKDENTDWK